MRSIPSVCHIKQCFWKLSSTIYERCSCVCLCIVFAKCIVYKCLAHVFISICLRKFISLMKHPVILLHKVCFIVFWYSMWNISFHPQKKKKNNQRFSLWNSSTSFSIPPTSPFTQKDGTSVGLRSPKSISASQ